MSNYNLMRLANLYGGMNKSAESNPPTPPMGEGDKINYVLRALSNIANPVKRQEAFDSFLRMSMSENNLATPITGSQDSSNIVASGASGAEPPVLGTDAAGNTIVLQPGKAPGMLSGVEKWVKENPVLASAIGAGALGLGGYGAYKALSNDDEERKKSASIDHLTETEVVQPRDSSLTLNPNMAQFIQGKPTEISTLDPNAIAQVVKTEPQGYTFSTEAEAMERLKEEITKNPSLLEKIKDWIAANPGKSTAIGAGALGLGGLGAYALMNNDEEEDSKKSASYIDPYTAQVLAHDYITKMAKANGIPAVAAGVTGVSNYLNY